MTNTPSEIETCPGCGADRIRYKDGVPYNAADDESSVVAQMWQCGTKLMHDGDLLTSAECQLAAANSRADAAERRAEGLREVVRVVRSMLPAEIPTFADKELHQYWCEVNHLLAVDIPDLIERALAGDVARSGDAALKEGADDA